MGSAFRADGRSSCNLQERVSLELVLSAVPAAKEYMPDAGQEDIAKLDYYIELMDFMYKHRALAKRTQYLKFMIISQNSTILWLKGRSFIRT